MRAVWNEATLAEAAQENLISIDNNWYFPPESLTGGRFQASETDTSHDWQGEAHYYHVSVDDQIAPDAAWYYPEPKDSAVETVGRDFTGYVAFDRHTITVSGETAV